jgi:hypothetical protein
MERCSSTDSVSLFDDDTGSSEKPKLRTLLIWPQKPVLPRGMAGFMEVFGSFTQPPWSVPLALHICPDTGVSWLSLEEALPRLHSGQYDFKFLLDGKTWMINPALPTCRSGPIENNFLHINYRLLNRLEGRLRSGSGQMSPRNVDSSCVYNDPQHLNTSFDSIKDVEITMSYDVCKAYDDVARTQHAPRRNQSAADRLNLLDLQDIDGQSALSKKT